MSTCCREEWAGVRACACPLAKERSDGNSGSVATLRYSVKNVLTARERSYLGGNMSDTI